MKKIIIALAALLTVATTANAQQMYQRGWSSLDSPNSISVGYGLSAIGIALNTVSNYFSFVDDIAQEDITISNGGSSGFINLSYGYQLNRTFTIGGNFGYNRLSLDLKDNTGSVSAAALKRSNSLRCMQMSRSSSQGINPPCLTAPRYVPQSAKYLILCFLQISSIKSRTVSSIAQVLFVIDGI